MEILLKIAVSVISYFLKKRGDSIQDQKDFIAFTEIMDRKGLSSVKMRIEATNQMQRIKDAWTEEMKGK